MQEQVLTALLTPTEVSPVVIMNFNRSKILFSLTFPFSCMIEESAALWKLSSVQGRSFFCGNVTPTGQDQTF